MRTLRNSRTVQKIQTIPEPVDHEENDDEAPYKLELRYYMK
jgi:hypothetical protein